MDQKGLAKFKKILLNEKQRVLNNSRKSLDEIKIDTDDLMDETDLAAAEVNQNLTFRLRDRERMLLTKIDEALARVENGSFGTCESCEDPIEPRRLEARPMSTMCVKCKEAKEIRKKSFA